MSASPAPTSADPVDIVDLRERALPPQPTPPHPSTPVARRRRGGLTRRFETYVEVAPSGGSGEAYLDGLRAVAVLAVVTFHSYLWSRLPHLGLFGTTVDHVLAASGWGVDLFFVLSGYLLSRSWFDAEIAVRPRPRVGRFFLRRAARIVPAYYLSIAVVLLAFAPLGLVPLSTLTGTAGSWNLLLHLTFLAHLVPLSSAHFATIGGVYWTLTIEFLFYLSLPLFVRCFSGRWSIRTPAICLGVAVLWTYLSLHSWGGLVSAMAGSVDGAGASDFGVPPDLERMRVLLAMQLPTWLFAFALGIALSRLMVRHRAGLVPSPWLHARVGPWAVLAGVVLLVALSDRQGASVFAGEPVQLSFFLIHLGCQASLGLVLFGLAVGPDWLRRPLEALPMRYIGWTSYGFYLFHVPVLTVVTGLTTIASEVSVGRFLLILALTLLLTTLAASISWMFVERPFILAIQRRPRRPVRVAAARPARRTRWRAVVIGSGLLLLPALVVGQTATRRGAAESYDGPMGQIRNVSMSARQASLHGPGGAAGLGLVLLEESRILRRCGASVGVTEKLRTSGWSGVGTVFTCRSTTAAARALSATHRMELELGYERTDGPRSVRAYELPGEGDARGAPYGLHVRYRSGPRLVAFELQCAGREVCQDALGRLVPPVLSRFPATS